MKGVSPLLMHNGQTADPRNPFSKQMSAITGKKQKTDEDRAELSRIEWHAGLYVNAEHRLILPAIVIEASLVDGAKKSRLGKAFKSSVFIDDDSELVIDKEYGKAEELWEDEDHRHQQGLGSHVDVRPVKLKGVTVIRTRPIFRNWAADFELMFDDEQVNHSDVMRAAVDAGRISGVGDFRPRFGRFDVEVLS